MEDFVLTAWEEEREVEPDEDEVDDDPHSRQKQVKPASTWEREEL